MNQHKAPRNTALDAARGLAVFAMIAVHLLPYEAEEGAGTLTVVGARIAEFLWDKPAPVFCLVAGMAIALNAATAGQMVARAGALLVFGLVFRAFVFPTEILSPLALMMVVGYAVWRAGAVASWIVAAAVVGAVPCLHAAFGELVAADWTDAGDHLADSEFGWVTLRYYTIDGNYALVPWLLFVLVGALWARGDLDDRRRSGVVAVAGSVALVAGEFYRVWSDEQWDYDELADIYAVMWEPMATLPFVVICASTAVAVVGAFLWLGENPMSRFLAQLGRASLTHYVLHIVAVFVPLRSAFPDEDWTMRVGATAFAGYVLFAVPATLVWFRHFDRGPLEGLWAGCRWRR